MNIALPWLIVGLNVGWMIHVYLVRRAEWKRNKKEMDA